jgi:hypothetical protein
LASVFAALSLLAGCASVDPYQRSPMAEKLGRDDDIGYCARLFAEIDRRIEHLDLRDAQEPRIPGFPYLRVDRATAALAARAETPSQRRLWWLRLAQLDHEARAIELGNASLAVADLARCRALLGEADDAAFESLRAAATVPDHYSVAQRALGLYPLTRLPFAAGIARWHAAVQAVYATPLAELPRAGRLQRYGLAGAGSARTVLLPTAADVLGVPELSSFDRVALLAQHAPILEIDVAADHDRPGALVLDADDAPVVDVAQPTVYTRLTHAVLAGRVHLQLVYTFWFTERPARSALDLLAGRLDGLVWRVTLDHDGTPLVYDSMHACGCYHLFFPTQHMVQRPAPRTLDEGMFSPQQLRAPQPGEAIVLRVASGTHYVQRASVEPGRAAEVHYRAEDERRLAVLPRRGGGTRSAYGSDGLMAGSERAERFVFWPMGVVAPGQMRQWGHHATAFVGRRHFDDPHLLDAYFMRRR